MYVLIAACVKNPNLRAKGITKPSDIAMFERCLERCRDCGIETLFLPCPETIYLGADRLPGSFLERLNTKEFSEILDGIEKDLRAEFARRGEMPACIIGVDSSPSCGVNTTYVSDVKERGRGAFLKRFSDIPAYDVSEFSMYKIYLAAPLFSEAEREFNAKIAGILREKKYVVHLPQEVGDDSSTRDEAETGRIFEYNLKALDECDIVVAVVDGADADSGTAWEIGYAYAVKKRVILLRTDFRRVGRSEAVNLMLEESGEVVGSVGELVRVLGVTL
ncbi:MAG: nucleoside 2-deoxyribosyltransferase [Methanomicrobium sp.]|nr:nucleoside 2-deoxyribosyltransferase [Methanomicrobium sp.]